MAAWVALVMPMLKEFVEPVSLTLVKLMPGAREKWLTGKLKNDWLVIGKVCSIWCVKVVEDLPSLVFDV